MGLLSRRLQNIKSDLVFWGHGNKVKIGDWSIIGKTRGSHGHSEMVCSLIGEHAVVLN